MPKSVFFALYCISFSLLFACQPNNSTSSINSLQIDTIQGQVIVQRQQVLADNYLLSIDSSYQLDNNAISKHSRHAIPEDLSIGTTYFWMENWRLDTSDVNKLPTQTASKTYKIRQVIEGQAKEQELIYEVSIMAADPIPYTQTSPVFQSIWATLRQSFEATKTAGSSINLQAQQANFSWTASLEGDGEGYYHNNNESAVITFYPDSSQAALKIVVSAPQKVDLSTLIQAVEQKVWE